MKNSELQEQVISDVSKALYKKIDESPFTIEEVAKKAKMSTGYLKQLKAGERRLNIFYLYVIAKAINKYPSEVLPLDWQKSTKVEIDPLALAEAIHDVLFITRGGSLSLFEKAELIAKLYPTKLEEPGITDVPENKQQKLGDYEY